MDGPLSNLKWVGSYRLDSSHEIVCCSVVFSSIIEEGMIKYKGEAYHPYHFNCTTCRWASECYVTFENGISGLIWIKVACSVVIVTLMLVVPTFMAVRHSQRETSWKINLPFGFSLQISLCLLGFLNQCLLPLKMIFQVIPRCMVPHVTQLSINWPFTIICAFFNHFDCYLTL